jgi:hypothetical protein
MAGPAAKVGKPPSYQLWPELRPRVRRRVHRSEKLCCLGEEAELIISDAVLTANPTPVHGDNPPRWRAAVAVRAAVGKRLRLPHRLVRKLDDALRRLYDVREFSERPGCLLRIAIRRAAVDVCLADGCGVPRGAKILGLHLWNEHLPSLSPRSSNLGRANALRRQIGASLDELAGYVASDPLLDCIVALRARTALVPRKRLPKLLRIARAYGFDTVTSDASTVSGHGCMISGKIS